MLDVIVLNYIRQHHLHYVGSEKAARAGMLAIAEAKESIASGGQGVSLLLLWLLCGQGLARVLLVIWLLFTCCPFLRTGKPEGIEFRGRRVILFIVMDLFNRNSQSSSLGNVNAAIKVDTLRYLNLYHVSFWQSNDLYWPSYPAVKERNAEHRETH